LDPVVKPLDITVKKETGKVVETSGDENVVKRLATKGSFENIPRAQNDPKKRAPKVFEFSKF